jgi:DNA-binding response OmpR family regulator
LKFLIIEDEKVLVDSIKTYLTEEGNICEVANNVRSATEKISLYEYDAIILDIGLPDGTGLEILNYLKSLRKDTGIIIVSARNALDDRLKALDLGADDYLVKPFHLAELKARLMAIYRRRNFKGQNLLKYDIIEIDLDRRDVKVDDQLLTLTKREYEMLLYFIANRGKVITHSALVDHLWKDEVTWMDSFDFLYTHIKNLRRKLSEVTGKDYISSVYGLGYKFN